MAVPIKVLFLVLVPSVTSENLREIDDACKLSGIQIPEYEMKHKLLAAACFVLSISTSSSSTANTKLLGTWEGESKCTTADSACHDEHVIYRIATVKHAPGKLALHGYKVSKGQLMFMGTLDCLPQADQATLTCTGNTPRKDRWKFRVSGRVMTGALTRGEEKIAYRSINVTKK